VTFATVPRAGHAVAGWEEIATAVGPERAAAMRASVVPADPIAGSATAVRERIARGEDVSDLVPEPVARFLEERGLYRPKGD